jgi:TAG lipase / steryl ester hydrolase / phospholipase A2 / LPA acyltransferase
VKNLSQVVKRNCFGIDQEQLHSQATLGTKLVIEEFVGTVNSCLAFLASSSSVPTEQKLSFFRKLDWSLGKTALGLSGGGSLGCFFKMSRL